MRMTLRLSLLLSLLLTITACTFTPGIKPINNAADLKSDEILIVGKIRLVPKFDPTEQSLPTMMINRELVEEKLFLAIDDELKPIEGYASYSGLRKVASVPFNKTFMVAAKRTDPMIFSGAFFIVGSGQGPDNYYLPGGLKLNYSKKDKAIYIGTIEFHRNDYDEITKVKLIDEYTQANKVFTKIHGKKLSLKKIKTTTVK